LLDTDICSPYLRGVRLVWNRFLQYGGRLYVSVVTLTELELWLLRKNTPPRYLQAFLGMLRDGTVLEVDGAVAHRAGEVGAGLRDQGLAMPTPDLLVAATALVHGLTLVTHNTRHFAHVPGLSLDVWLVP
jgi:tRNA(fMet)-specific endonuclease VapC